MAAGKGAGHGRFHQEGPGEASRLGGGPWDEEAASTRSPFGMKFVGFGEQSVLTGGQGTDKG